MKLLERLITIIRHPGALFHYNTFDNAHYIDYLRNNGMTIGDNTRFISPSNCTIDPGRMEYITIGDNCCLSNIAIIAHDYSWYTFLDAFDDIVPDAGGKISIGNNVFCWISSLYSWKYNNR